MNSSGSSSCFQNLSSQRNLEMYGLLSDDDHVVSSPLESNSTITAETYSNELLYSLSVLKERAHQVQSLVNVAVTVPGANQQPTHETVSMAISGMRTLIQEIMFTASSMMFTCQQLSSLGASPAAASFYDTGPANYDHHGLGVSQLSGHTMVHVDRELNGGNGFFPDESSLDWFGENCNISNGSTIIDTSHSKSSNADDMNNNKKEVLEEEEVGFKQSLQMNYDIIELDAKDLLARFTHYCQVCGKGFKRDANLRMHMRAHGDEFKSTAALINPMKSSNVPTVNSKDYSKLPRKYSCPQEGCRWNRKHAKFQPLKSMICVKNHYKRIHCPKMYVCNRCNLKQFSVLSDLRTHEKHCGDLKWRCSCGTTFSRKDKLMGHVALFIGHAPAAGNSFMKQENNCFMMAPFKSD